jgi:hypothetical protein
MAVGGPALRRIGIGDPILASFLNEIAEAAEGAGGPGAGLHRPPISGAPAVPRARRRGVVRVAVVDSSHPASAEAPFRDVTYDLRIEGTDIVVPAVPWQRRIVPHSHGLVTGADELMIYPARVLDHELPDEWFCRCWGEMHLFRGWGDDGDGGLEFPHRVFVELYGEVVSEC